ncbi:hypothetical protein [Candidatus Nitrosocosmicus hydrocola]|uniref:hypothetical protein n=1 Tax=Candidatus Nitrosocosmicus hydrocola TaxID=1826872 RepID=UPI0011E5E869|nr:hypothetical protein [Candidatus Nitrosocosmicus hydrocola]
MLNNILNISAGLLAISYFVIFGASYYEYANAISSNVSAGGDGDSWDKYTPQNVTITAGENVTWTNPMKVVEPHTVTFVKDKEMIPPLVAPFNVPNNTQFIAAIPAANVEPSIIPDNTNPNDKLVIVDNQRASAPVTIDDTKASITYLQPNSNYSFVGDESYVNSGFMFPMGLVPPRCTTNYLIHNDL